MGTETMAVKVRATPRARMFEAEWAMGGDRFVVLTVRHSTNSRALIATLRREREERSNGMVSRIYAPFQDMTRIDYERVSRYSAGRAKRYFDEQLERVRAVLAGRRDPERDLITMMFERGTEA